MTRRHREAKGTPVGSITLLLAAAAILIARPALADDLDPSVSPDPTVSTSPTPIPLPDPSPTPIAPLADPVIPTPSDEAPATSPTPAGAAGEGRARAGDRTAAAAQDNRFAPRELTVTAGTGVVWTNEGQNLHTVTADDRAFDSGTLQSGQNFAVTFDTVGRFPYYCQIHGEPGSGMFALVIVQPAQVEGTGSPPPGPTDDTGGTAATGFDPTWLALLAGSLGVGLLSLRLGRARSGEGR
ncbi:MAG: plastocyanin/azurin family copper-binding protein [Actinomycetota bacterium]